MSEQHSPLTYKDAGVDIDAGNALIKAISPKVAATKRPGVMGGLGGFGGFFDPKAAGFNDPILVAATDGVGTKLKVAIDTGRLDGVGVDLVAMCVNDLVVQGAEPLFFLDYFATGHLDVENATDIIGGIAEGCREAGCGLIGGETAEMPGMYKAGDFDLAGFAVGAVERGQELTGADVRAGDVLIGMTSKGLHSNGYSLVRKVVAASGLGYGDPAPFDPETTLGAALMVPTQIYVASCLDLVRSGHVKALAHITGGGLVENIPRVLPKGLAADLDAALWPYPDLFKWIAGVGRIAPEEMARTFNCGIGMVLAVAPEKADATLARLLELGDLAFRIGDVIALPEDAPQEAGVFIANLDAWETGGAPGARVP